MPANIAVIDGKTAAFTADEKAWWDILGERVVKGQQEWKKAIKEAGLDWQVVKKPLFCKDLKQKVFELPDRVAIYRDVDNAYIGNVSKTFEVVQNDEGFQWVDTLLEAENGAHYESAGALGNGAQIWLLAKVPFDINIAGTDDKSENFLLLSMAHDGSQALTAKLTSVRVVCWNTLQQALQGEGAVLRMKHTKNIHVRMDSAKAVWKGVEQTVKTLEEKLNTLASRRMTRESAKAIFDRLFPPRKGEKGEEVESKRRENTLSKIYQLYDSNDQNQIPEIRGTAYNLLNAVTEFTDHQRGVRVTKGREEQKLSDDEIRKENAIFGGAAKFKEDALEVILEQTAGNPVHKIKHGMTVPDVPGILGDVIAQTESAN